MNLVNYARVPLLRLSLFNTHAMILIFRIFMNENKLFPLVIILTGCGDSVAACVHFVLRCFRVCWFVQAVNSPGLIVQISNS